MSAQVIQFRPRPRPRNPAADAFAAFALFWTVVFAAAAFSMGHRDER